MKSPAGLVRLKTFHMREKQRHLQQLENMELEFRRMADALSEQIAEEERRAGISDVSHFAYPIFAKAARARRDNLLNSIENLRTRKDAARLLLRRAESELEKAVELAARESGLAAAPAHSEEEMRFSRRRAMIG